MNIKIGALLVTLSLGFIAAAVAADNYRQSVPGGTTITKRAVEMSAGVYSDVVVQGAEYPAGAVPIVATALGTTGATTATLTASATRTTYVCGFSARANATAAVTGNLTISGPVTGMNFTAWTAPLASGIGVVEQGFKPCVPASAVNTTIVITHPAPGAGGTVSVTAWGYQL